MFINSKFDLAMPMMIRCLVLSSELRNDLMVEGRLSVAN